MYVYIYVCMYVCIYTYIYIWLYLDAEVLVLPPVFLPQDSVFVSCRIRRNPISASIDLAESKITYACIHTYITIKYYVNPVHITCAETGGTPPPPPPRRAI